ncbi:50S ribosomal protein L15e [Candidatus Pacearchaeota archaeon]|nr:50S ribosomal protein L15e [Candidatus Pacearchaeota archaeon]
MAQSMYHYLREAWKKPDMVTLRERMIAWRAGGAVEVVDKPLRLDRARSLGYKAKKGFIVARIRVMRGGRTRTRIAVKGRKSRKQTNRKTLKMSYRWVAEMRATKYFNNLEVLNSYWIGKDGKHYFYEVILVDPAKPEIKNDRTLNWINGNSHSGRVERGLTSAGKQSRGLTTRRGHSPTLKVRPSLRSWNRKGK